jgi:hypothetical protein
MDEFNAYAPPKFAESDEGGLLEHANAAWRDGKLLMVRKGAILPDRCLKCNEPAEGYQFKSGFGLFSAGLIVGMVGSRVLVPARIDRHFIWLSKVSPLYLATFPDANVR